MPQLRNPGPWSFGVFVAAASLVAFLYWRGAPEAGKLAGTLIGLLVATFGARSALGAPPKEEDETPTRAPMVSWPEQEPETRPDRPKSNAKGGDA